MIKIGERDFVLGEAWKTTSPKPTSTGTIQHVAAELNAEGTDYLLLPDDGTDRRRPMIAQR